MIVAMQEKATEEQIDAVIDAMVEAGVGVHRTTGAMQTILAGVGPTASLDLSKFENLAGVLHVHRISSPYKLAGRGFRPEGTVVEFRNGVTVGGRQVAVMAGPCSIENRAQIFETAKRVKESGGIFLRGGAYKPRSSPYAFQGMGIPGLELMREGNREAREGVRRQLLARRRIQAAQFALRISGYGYPGAGTDARGRGGAWPAGRQ